MSSRLPHMPGYEVFVSGTFASHDKHSVALYIKTELGPFNRSKGLSANSIYVSLPKFGLKVAGLYIPFKDYDKYKLAYKKVIERLLEENYLITGDLNTASIYMPDNSFEVTRLGESDQGWVGSAIDFIHWSGHKFTQEIYPSTSDHLVLSKKYQIDW